MRIKLTTALFLLPFRFLLAQSNDAGSDQHLLLSKAQNFLSEASISAPEKFYIVTDRHWYLSGEDVWFKTYITSGVLPGTSSAVLYVSLADSSGRVLIKKIIPVDDNGVSYGSIHLPPDLKRGWYSLVVQTEWNRNFNDGIEKLLFINERGKPLESISVSDFLNATQNKVQFFPEGGNFISGLQNHFGVKIIGEKMKPEPVKGYIMANNDTLANFETSVSGLGEFTLPPSSESAISAIVIWPNGSKTIHPLPEVKSEGITLQASIRNERLFYKIESSLGFLSGEAEILLAIIMHDEIVFSKSFQSMNELRSYADYIPVKNFPEGIISLAIFSSEGKKIAERDIFHLKEKTISLERNEISFEPKSRNEITISIPDTLFGSYSITITDADLTADELTENMSAKPPGNSFTLKEKIKNNKKDVDLYLLTVQKNFEYRERNISSYQFGYQQGMTISGRMTYQKTGKPVTGKIVNLFLKGAGAGNLLFSDSLDGSGKFILRDMFLEDSSVLYWNINGIDNKELNKVNVLLDKNWFDSMTMRPTILQMRNRSSGEPEEKIANVTMKENLDKYYFLDSLDKKSKILPEVTVYAKQRERIEQLDKKFAGTSLFGGRLGFVYAFDLEEEKGFYSNIFTYLRTRVPGLRIMGSPYNPLLFFRAPMALQTDTPNVAVFINEVRSEAGDMASIPVEQIAYVKVFKPPFSYVLLSEPKSMYDPPIALIIAIYLRTDAAKIPIRPAGPPSLKNIQVPGFTLPKFFPAPDYNKEKEFENTPDKRITLYWNPELELENGKAKIIFYNNDFSKRFLVKVEGVNELGEVIHFRQIIEQ